QCVIRPGGGQPALTVRMPGVVQQLILGSAPVDVVVLLGAAIENTGVATRTQLPVERELKVAELIFGDDVVHRSGFGEDAVDDPPTSRHRLGLVTAPCIGVCAVEERAPTSSALFSR